jgi:hypothetical protein
MLDVLPFDPVDFVLAEVASYLGLQDVEYQLVLVDFSDGQQWVLNRDTTMDEVVHRTGSTTFLIDFEPDH